MNFCCGSSIVLMTVPFCILTIVLLPLPPLPSLPPFLSCLQIPAGRVRPVPPARRAQNHHLTCRPAPSETLCLPLSCSVLEWSDSNLTHGLFCLYFVIHTLSDVTVVKLFFFSLPSCFKGVKQVYCSNEKHIFTVINIYKYIYIKMENLYMSRCLKPFVLPCGF